MIRSFRGAGLTYCSRITDDSVRVEFECCWSKLVQLVGLEGTTGRGGQDSIDHGPGGHDDLINAVAGALVRAGAVGFVGPRMLAPRRAEAATPAAERTAAEAERLREIEDSERAEIWCRSEVWSRWRWFAQSRKREGSRIG